VKTISHGDDLGGERSVEGAADQRVDQHPLARSGREAERPQTVIRNGKAEDEGCGPRDAMGATEPRRSLAVSELALDLERGDQLKPGEAYRKRRQPHLQVDG
jgi:hypothetical protein